LYRVLAGTFTIFTTTATIQDELKGE